MKRQLFILFLILCFSTLIYAQWSENPATNNAICDLSGEQAIPKVVTSITGDTYIGYFSNDSGNYDVRLQRLDSQGNELWEHNGILVSDNTAMTWLTDWDMTVDDDNHAILVFQDIRNGGNNNIYVYKILSDGTFIWGNDGIELSNSTAFDVAPKVCVTSDGVAVITWQSDDAIIMQRIAGNGTLVWGPNGITLSCADRYSWPQPFAVENDHILLKFFHDSGPAWAPTRYCYIQKFDNDGDAVWANDTVVSNAGGITAWTQVFNIITDGNNGCFISWHDSRGGGTISYPFAQHVNADGTVAFTANGVQLTTEMDRQSFYPESVYYEDTNELITYWGQTDGNQNNHGITGQKVDVTGNLLWGDNGNNLISISSDYIQMVGLRKANEDLMLFLEDYTNAVDAHVVAAKIDQDGNYAWTEEQITMCSVESEKVHNVVSQLSNGMFVASWEDSRNGGKDIYAQNINLDGTLGASILNGTIEGNVTLNGGSGIVTEVEVETGGVIVNPDTNGDYIITLAPGTYDVTASLEDYTPQTTPPIVVTSGNIISGVDFILEPIVSTEDVIIAHNELGSNYPNPFNPVTNIFYTIKEISNVTIQVYNLKGQLIKMLVNENKETGEYSVIWDGTDISNKPVSSGVYLYKMRSGSYSSSRKMILMK
ncbi:MAG: T9SS type A sorting domain-containing protein [Candidatus Tenebribacter davisii]|nr:T9SS type A sorting domain-containing protein [Candidatus Tenebribacter davisii]